MHQDWAKVARWANKNFLKPRSPKQKQLWLWSTEGSLGKSHPWLETLKSFYKKYLWQKIGTQQSKEVMTCDYIVIDELSGSIKVTELKEISQMMGFSLNLKWGDIVAFERNVPLIVTSNRPPNELYHHCALNDIKTLECRFKIIEVKEKWFLKVKSEEILVPASPFSPLPSPDRDPEDHSEISNEDWDLMSKLREKTKK